MIPPHRGIPHTCQSCPRAAFSPVRWAGVLGRPRLAWASPAWVPRRGHPLGAIFPGPWSLYGHPPAQRPPRVDVPRVGLPHGQPPGGRPRWATPPEHPLPAGGTPSLGPSRSYTTTPVFLSPNPAHGVEAREEEEPTGMLLSCWGLNLYHLLFLYELFLRGGGNGGAGNSPKAKAQQRRKAAFTTAPRLPLPLWFFFPPIPWVNVHAIIFIYSQDTARIFLNCILPGWFLLAFKTSGLEKYSHLGQEQRRGKWRGGLGVGSIFIYTFDI